MAVTNVEIIFNGIEPGQFVASQIFEIRTEEIDIKKTELKENEILVKAIYISIEPYLRGKFFIDLISKGQPFVSPGVAEVLKSNNSNYFVGDVLNGGLKWAEYSVLNPNEPTIFGPYTKIPKARELEFPVSYYLGLLGIPGLTGYVGLHKICEPLTSGQTLFVSGSTGGVGQAVGQYGKALGLRVVGCGKDDDKVSYLVNDLGFDAAFNYKKHEYLESILRETCPEGIDIYFDNVGGKLLDAVLKVCNDGARIALCGCISQYGRLDNPEPMYNIMQQLVKRIRMEGFIGAFDFPRYGPEATQKFLELLKDGKMKYKEDISEGIRSLPEAFVKVCHGKNFGKPVVHIANL